MTASFGPRLTALARPNGVGKSTLLRIPAGEIDPCSEHVRRPARVGLLRQVEFAGGAGSAAIADGLIRSALGRAGIHADPDQALSHLSGGQQTRARLAALIAARPDALLLDEPTNHLDAEARVMREEAIDSCDAALIIVSHDRDFMKAVGTTREITLPC